MCLLLKAGGSFGGGSSSGLDFAGMTLKTPAAEPTPSGAGLDFGGLTMKTTPVVSIPSQSPVQYSAPSPAPAAESVMSAPATSPAPAASSTPEDEMSTQVCSCFC